METTVTQLFETNFNVVPDTAADTPEFVNVTCTDDAVPGRALEGVPDPITTTTCVPLEHEHDAAAVLVVGTLLPTRAVHAKPEIKLAPVTVIVLPAYADKGAMEAAVGAATTVSVVPATVATLATLVNSGIPIIDSLQRCISSSSNQLVKNTLMKSFLS